jgi:proteasome lid subunit RPN8/RPN11
MLSAAVTLTQSQYDQMLMHVMIDPTLERCGLLAGHNGRVEQVLPVPNVLASPVAYQMDGSEFVQAMLACDFEPLGIFHSHPAGPPVPSPTDVAQALYPDSTYIIISLAANPPSVRAFRIVQQQVHEVPLWIEGE